jgi:hypothetical protein
LWWGEREKGCKWWFERGGMWLWGERNEGKKRKIGIKGYLSLNLK